MGTRAPLPAVLLPGLDGSGRLYAPMLSAGCRRIAPTLVAYPNEPLDYAELLALARAALPRRGSFLLVAESFSGPIAIRLAAERPRGLAGLVLAATFLHRPLNPVLHPLRGLVGARFFGFPMPAVAVRHFLAGPDAPNAIVTEVQAAVSVVSPEVMALRAAEALVVDVREDLRRVEAPVLYLGPTRDRLIRTDVAGEIASLAAAVEISMFDSPHMILQRRPHASLDRIERFAVAPGERPGVWA